MKKNKRIYIRITAPADGDTYNEMRWWCINNIPRENTYRKWWTLNEKERTAGMGKRKSASAKYGDDYEIDFIFEYKKDAKAFVKLWGAYINK